MIHTIQFLLFLFLIVGSAQAEDLSSNKFINPSSNKKGRELFDLAVGYHKKGELQKALESYARTIKVDRSLAPLSYFNIAKIFKQQKDLRRARLAIEKVNVEFVSDTLKARVIHFKESLSISSSKQSSSNSQNQKRTNPPPESDEEKRFYLYYDLSLGSNNNPEYTSSFSDFDFQWIGKLYLGYKIGLGNAYEIASNYAFNSITYDQNHDSSTTYHSFALPSSYYFGQSRVRLTPEYVIDTFAGETFSNTLNLTLDYTVKFKNYILTLHYQRLYTEVADASNDHLNGNANKYTTSLKRRGRTWDLGLSLSYSSYDYDDSIDIISSYSGPLINTHLTYYFNNWDFSLYSSLEKRSYVVDSDGFEQRDYKTITSFTTGWTHSQWLRLFISTTYTNNSSNDSESSYHQTSYLFGFSGGY